jgi:formylglycine-generating enzyme required for sulfatase activity
MKPMTPLNQSLSPQDGSQEQYQDSDLPPSEEDSEGSEGASFASILFRILIIAVVTCIVLGGTVGVLSWVLNRPDDPTNDENVSDPDGEIPSVVLEASNATDWPFDPVEARRRQNGAAQTLEVPVEYKNDIGMTFRIIPVGDFIAGTNGEEMGERGSPDGPAHPATITQAFYMSCFETTQRQWHDVMETLSAEYLGSRRIDVGEDLPVHMVTWYDAVEFCNALSILEGYTPFYSISEIRRNPASRGIKQATVQVRGGVGYRLPREVEWEFACRGGSNDKHYGEPKSIGWHFEEILHPVGRKSPNAFLIYDMSGNVREWCHDWIEEGYMEWTYPEKTYRPASSVRGGSVARHSDFGTSAYRSQLALDKGQCITGVRVARSVTMENQEELDPCFPQFEELPHVATIVSNDKQARIHEQSPSHYIDESLTRQYDLAEMMELPVECKNELDMRFRFIPPNSFIMGTPAYEETHAPTEQPGHEVIIRQPYYMSVCEVTRKEWKSVMGYQHSTYQGSSTFNDEYPTHENGWYDAIDFCNRLSRRDGLAPYYDLEVHDRSYSGTYIEQADVKILGGSGYRLPTEPEWEYACRGGIQAIDLIDVNEIDINEVAWHDGNNEGEKWYPVGKKLENPFLLHDMLGNVSEWCQNGFEEPGAYDFDQYPEDDPTRLGTGNFHAIRGAHANSPSSVCRPAMRGMEQADLKRLGIGFRIAFTPPNAQDDENSNETTPEPQTPPLSSEQPPTLRTWPFDAREAQRRISVTAENYRLPPRRSNDLGMSLQLIPPGEFLCGSPENEPGRNFQDADLHRAVIERPFYMSAYETTQQEWEYLMGDDYFVTVDGESLSLGVRYAMCAVTWHDAAAFCNALNEREGLSPYYELTNIERFSDPPHSRNANVIILGGPDTPHIKSADVKILGGPGYRLPTNNEWEYACRAGTEGPLYGEADAIGWSQSNSRNVTYAVGEKLPNAFHLYDMMGHFDEWCEDWPDDIEFHYGGVSPISGTDMGDFRILRGGQLNSHPQSYRAAARNAKLISESGGGIRIVYSPPGFEPPLPEEPVRIIAPSLPRKTPYTTLYTEWPFDADDARQRQSDTALGLNLPTEVENEIGMAMRLIPAGDFSMGGGRSVNNKSDAVHNVRISHPFYIGKYEVTLEQWAEISRQPGDERGDLFPVQKVSWYDAAAFCNALSEREGLSSCYELSHHSFNPDAPPTGVTKVRNINGNGYRLPTEAEWEYACLAGATSRSNGELDDIAWYVSNAAMTQQVGTRQANAWGLHDTIGNVSEFCHDIFDVDYYETTPFRDPTGPEVGVLRVVRGGTAYENNRCSPTIRHYTHPGASNQQGFGFRVMRPVELAE